MRSHSRVPSRATSPALSTKSRKSVMSNRNAHRSSYIEHDFSDEDSSNSDGYLEDFRSVRNGDRRESHRSLRSSRRSLRNQSPPLGWDDDSEEQQQRQENGRSGHHRQRRAGSATRSVRNDKKSRKNSSEITQDSGSELGTRAKVQAKIREKIAQQHQSSMDESSSDFFKPKTQTPSTTKTTTADGKVKKVSSEAQTSSVVKTNGSRSTTDESSAKTSGTESATAMVVTVTKMSTSGAIGPPPKTPNFEWTCEYCTFANEANTKICAICCKTPSNAPLKASTNTVTDEIVDDSAKPNGTNENGIQDEKPKGRKLSKKISFWPGTKSK